MINSKYDLKEYLSEDKKALGIKRKHLPIFGTEIWKFERSLRYLEYYSNVKCFGGGVMRMFWHYIYHNWSIRLGFTVPVNTCGKGLNIHHSGCVVINGNARIGDYCNIQQCVNIGQNYSSDNSPTIGSNVYIGPGAKIFGKVTIADGCAIGAGAIVNKSFLEPDTVIVGNPARGVGKRKPGVC